MQLKAYTDYAIRVVTYLAMTKKITNSRELSEKLVIPQSIILKIGKQLHDNKIINVIIGVQGGYLLIKNPKEVTLFDIITIFESTIKINRCLEEDHFCTRNATAACSVRTVYSEIQERLENHLKSITISQLI